jgi:hypothetical protein
MVLEGKVRIAEIQGWIENPRIELAKKKISGSVGDRRLQQDEVFELMKSDPEIKLNELRDDIMRNGLREPLTLSHSGKLLDGNRRFFAIKHALAGMQPDNPDRANLEAVDAYVLTEDASEEDEENVLVEENFSPSLKIEWPDYVKALKVIEAHEVGLGTQEIARKFNWRRGKVEETLRIYKLIQEFIVFATESKDPDDESGGGLGISEQEAESIAAKSYQYFNEAQKSFFQQLSTDVDFKFQFFRWIHEGKFHSFPEVRVAHQAWKHPEARAALLSQEPTAAKSAKAILDYNNRLVRNDEEVAGRIEGFVKFLQSMTAAQIAGLPKATRENLESSLELVIRMSKATNEAGNEG